MNNDINELRKILFSALKDLSDKEKPMELDRAKAIADMGRVLVDTARVEVAFLKETGALKSTDFLPTGVRELPPTPPQQRRVTNGSGRDQ